MVLDFIEILKVIFLGDGVKLMGVQIPLPISAIPLWRA